VKILALELSSGRGSVAWSDATSDTITAEFANDRKHSGLFFEQLARSRGELPNPDRIAVGLGPGSYAGTRIAIAAAIGLSAATGAPLVGISSLRVMAVDAAEYIVVGDARRRSFYFARVQQRRSVEGPLLCDEAEMRDRIGATPLPVFSTEPLPDFPDVTIAYPSAQLLVQIALDEPLSDAPLEPMYLRDPHITQPRGG
jgi:tRNA threonylcarbamoyladenosine biosynthesis protein TsaB